MITSPSGGHFPGTAVTPFRFGFRGASPVTFPAARTAPAQAFRVPLPRTFRKAVPEAPEKAAHLGGASRTRFPRRLPFPLRRAASEDRERVFPGLTGTAISALPPFERVPRGPVFGPGAAVED